MPPICNKDCLHCTQADCINDTMVYADYRASASREREIILPRTAKQRRLAAQQKAYYEANRDRLAAQQKIRDRRLAAGYTQQALGDLIGVTNAAICNWEKCKVPADWAKLEQIFPGITKEEKPHGK